MLLFPHFVRYNYKFYVFFCFFGGHETGQRQVEDNGLLQATPCMVFISFRNEILKTVLFACTIWTK